MEWNDSTPTVLAHWDLPKTTISNLDKRQGRFRKLLCSTEVEAKAVPETR